MIKHDVIARLRDEPLNKRPDALYLLLVSNSFTWEELEYSERNELFALIFGIYPCELEREAEVPEPDFDYLVEQVFTHDDPEDFLIDFGMVAKNIFSPEWIADFTNQLLEYGGAPSEYLSDLNEEEKQIFLEQYIKMFNKEYYSSQIDCGNYYYVSSASIETSYGYEILFKVTFTEGESDLLKKPLLIKINK